MLIPSRASLKGFREGMDRKKNESNFGLPMKKTSKLAMVNGADRQIKQRRCTMVVVLPSQVYEI
jgi:hypothetical protein